MSAAVSNDDRAILAAALDIRRGFAKFRDVPAAERPRVALALRGLTDAKMQELLGTRASHGGHGIASHSRVG